VEKPIALTGDYRVAWRRKFVRLVPRADMLPGEARRNGMRQSWPAFEVLVALIGKFSDSR
jgi:hypothetical protein